MDLRWFTNGARTDFASTPGEAVRFIHDGFVECEAPETSDDAEQTPQGDNPTGKDELPNGTTDD